MTEKQPKTKKINDLEALATLVRSGNYAIPILDLGDRDSDGDPKLKQVPLDLLQSLFKTETNLHKVATSGKYSDLKNLPQLFSGNYADLSGKPNIPTKTSDLQNDSGFLTQHQDISGKADKSELSEVATSGKYADLSERPQYAIFNMLGVLDYFYTTTPITDTESGYYLVNLSEAAPPQNAGFFSPFDFSNSSLVGGFINIRYYNSNHEGIDYFTVPLPQSRFISNDPIKISSYSNVSPRIQSSIDVIYDPFSHLVGNSNTGPWLKIPILPDSSEVILEFRLLTGQQKQELYFGS